MDARYKIVFSGELQGSIKADEVIERLVTTFKIPEAQARVLVLDGNRHVLKKDLNERRARRYRDALENAGMIVHVVRMDAHPEELTLAPLESAPTGVSESNPAASAPAFTAGFEPSRCPACGRMRVEDGACLDCGVVRAKYLAGQAGSRGRSDHGRKATGRSSDPYEPPRADLISRAQKGGIRGPGPVPAAHGWSWIARGFWHFKTNPFAWILALLVLVGISIVLGLIPFAAYGDIYFE